MASFFSEGGYGMIPVLLFGFLTIAAAVLYLLRPERRFGGLALALGCTTAAAGTLGFAMGLMNVFRYIGDVPAEKHTLILSLGTAESLPNIVLAMFLLVIAGLIASIGAFRTARLPSPVSAR